MCPRTDLSSHGPALEAMDVAKKKKRKKEKMKRVFHFWNFVKNKTWPFGTALESLTCKNAETSSL